MAPNVCETLVDRLLYLLGLTGNIKNELLIDQGRILTFAKATVSQDMSY